MQTQWMDRRLTWLALGAVLGLTVAYYCPTEPAYADNAVMGEKFALATVDTAPTATEAVFVLDMVTGRLTGAAYNYVTGTFTQSYFRNLAVDFGAVERGEYVMVTGRGNLRTSGGGTPALGVLYVGELNSGLLNMYGFFYNQSQQVMPPQEIQLVQQFPWRAAR